MLSDVSRVVLRTYLAVASHLLPNIAKTGVTSQNCCVQHKVTESWTGALLESHGSHLSQPLPYRRAAHPLPRTDGTQM
eukprot:scaffold1638_cov112-Skeletonema_dohrnii-CCMP3373.AAC.21